MFRPNTKALLRRAGGRNVYGEQQVDAGQVVPCAVVHLNKKVQKTPVRADSSASRGNAEEFVSVSKILFPAKVQLAIGDVLEIHGVRLRATAVEPRLDVPGRLDHFEVDFEIAA